MEIWTQDEATFHGEFENFDAVWSWPKPEVVIDGLSRLERFAQEAGRDPASISVSVFAPPPRDAVIARFRETPVERVILMVPPQDEAATLKRMDRYAAWV